MEWKIENASAERSVLGSQSAHPSIDHESNSGYQQRSFVRSEPAPSPRLHVAFYRYRAWLEI